MQDLELMKAAVTLEGVLSGTSALGLFAEIEALTAENARIFAMVDAREQTIAELTALCDGYRGEVAGLNAGEEKTRAYWSSAYYRMEAKCEELQSALTRARAEGMEESARIVESWSWAEVALIGHPALRKIAAAIRAKATPDAP